MMNDSLFTLADQFIAYKRQNGRVYQTGTYYLEKYIQSASETNPQITVPDRKVKDKKWSSKTCNLRMTAIRSLLSYASEECVNITPLFASSKTIQNLGVQAGEIEYFEDYQMKAALNAPRMEKQSERRNKMLLILGYDAAMRIGEMTKRKVGNLFLDAEKPYIRILGKGENTAVSL